MKKKTGKKTKRPARKPRRAKRKPAACTHENSINLRAAIWVFTQLLDGKEHRIDEIIEGFVDDRYGRRPEHLRTGSDSMHRMDAAMQVERVLTSQATLFWRKPDTIRIIASRRPDLERRLLLFKIYELGGMAQNFVKHGTPRSAQLLMELAEAPQALRARRARELADIERNLTVWARVNERTAAMMDLARRVLAKGA